MASITDHVIKLQELTQKNLDILQALNDSFFTNQNHLSVNIGEQQYAIPSFISLENKLNSLIANFENLVKSPETGEAFFDFNGNSRAIQVRSYTEVPNSLVLTPVTEFEIENNNIFKDFLTPNPYIHLDVQSLPNDTTQVLVKKVVPINSELRQMFKSLLSAGQEESKISIRYDYKDLYKVLDSYTPNVDYIEYDSKLDLPIRKNIGTGVYVIEEILEDIIDENLDNFLTIKLRTDINDSSYMNALKYRLFDETIEKMLKVGDELVTFEGNAKLSITEIRPITNTIVVKVLHGEFLNLVPSITNNPFNISSLSKLKFYSPIDFDDDKYVKVSLEEDQYIFTAVAAINSRMNIQSPWGGGLIIDTYSLTYNDKDFQTYYKENVKNVGDILMEITNMSTSPLTKYTPNEYKEFTEFQPEVNVNNLQVVQINKHLNNSIAVQNIRSLYTQKTELQTQLTEVQAQINEINETLSSISFDDTTGRRTAYIQSLSSLNVRKNELITSITKIINEISLAASNSEIPIENAKYRIRGYFDISDIKWKDHIKGIRVQYRYKNADSAQNTAYTINDKFIFSDWNEMNSSDRERISVYDKEYKSQLSPITDNVNEPSFNQIDIPISQGETVDIRLKVVYDYGYPFTQTSSAWSSIINIEFPTEFLKDVKILDIIEENNNDIETNRFNNLIKEEGIPEHIGDKVIDQDITYFHKPENIASGFYTAERRIIPLKDKLTELSNLVTQLQDEILGSNSDKLTVSIKNGDKTIPLNKFSDNLIYLDSYAKIKNNEASGNYVMQSNGLATTVLNLSIANNSNHTIKLHSIFPGSRDIAINHFANVPQNNLAHYTTGNIATGNIDVDTLKNIRGVWMDIPVGENYSGKIIHTRGDLQSQTRSLPDVRTINSEPMLISEDVTPMKLEADSTNKNHPQRLQASTGYTEVYHAKNLRPKKDENGNPIIDENGITVYEYDGYEHISADFTFLGVAAAEYKDGMDTVLPRIGRAASDHGRFYIPQIYQQDEDPMDAKYIAQRIGEDYELGEMDRTGEAMGQYYCQFLIASGSMFNCDRIKKIKISTSSTKYEDIDKIRLIVYNASIWDWESSPGYFSFHGVGSSVNNPETEWMRIIDVKKNVESDGNYVFYADIPVNENHPTESYIITWVNPITRNDGGIFSNEQIDPDEIRWELVETEQVPGIEDSVNNINQPGRLNMSFEYEYGAGEGYGYIVNFDYRTRFGIINVIALDGVPEKATESTLDYAIYNQILYGQFAFKVPAGAKVYFKMPDDFTNEYNSFDVCLFRGFDYDNFYVNNKQIVYDDDLMHQYTCEKITSGAYENWYKVDLNESYGAGVLVIKNPKNKKIDSSNVKWEVWVEKNGSYTELTNDDLKDLDTTIQYSAEKQPNRLNLAMQYSYSEDKKSFTIQNIIDKDGLPSAKNIRQLQYSQFLIKVNKNDYIRFKMSPRDGETPEFNMILLKSFTEDKFVKGATYNTAYIKTIETKELSKGVYVIEDIGDTPGILTWSDMILDPSHVEWEIFNINNEDNNTGDTPGGTPGIPGIPGGTPGGGGTTGGTPGDTPGDTPGGGDTTGGTTGFEHIITELKNYKVISMQMLQTGNQYLYFRVDDVNTHNMYYGETTFAKADETNLVSKNNLLSLNPEGIKWSRFESALNAHGTTWKNTYFDLNGKLTKDLMFVYPKLTNKYGLCVDKDESNITLYPNDEIIIPIVVEFHVYNAKNALEVDGTNVDGTILKTMSFDIRPSLYKDPINYKFTVVSKYENTISDDILANQQETYNKSNSKYNIIFK